MNATAPAPLTRRLEAHPIRVRLARAGLPLTLAEALPKSDLDPGLALALSVEPRRPVAA